MAAPNSTISVIIPALNEEENIRGTVNEVLSALENRFCDHELVLIDDGSMDKTGQIMDELAAQNPKIRVLHNPRPSNFGGAYKKGVAAARMEYVMMVPGDNQFPAASIAKVLEKVGEADIVVPFTANQRVRPWSRRVASRAFTTIVNLLFGQRLKYYNGIVIHRRDILNTISITTDSFAYQAEALVKLLRKGHSYVEVGTEIVERSSGKSAALRLKNLTSVFSALAHLVRAVYFPPKQTATTAATSHIR
jgi:dolichol-phosphate mannosyltransferase